MITATYIRSGAVWFYEGLPYRVKTHAGVEGVTGGYDSGLYGVIDWWGESMLQVTTLVFGKEVKSTLLFEDMSPSKI